MRRCAPEHLRLLLHIIHLRAHLRSTCVRGRVGGRACDARRELRAGASLVHPPTPIGVMSAHHKGGPEDDAVAMSFAPPRPWVTPAMSRALWHPLCLKSLCVLPFFVQTLFTDSASPEQVCFWLCGCRSNCLFPSSACRVGPRCSGMGGRCGDSGTTAGSRGQPCRCGGRSRSSCFGSSLLQRHYRGVDASVAAQSTNSISNRNGNGCGRSSYEVSHGDSVVGTRSWISGVSSSAVARRWIGDSEPGSQGNQDNG